MSCAIALEDSGHLLLEDESAIILEDCIPTPPTPPVQHGGIGRRGPYIDMEARRRRLSRDDEDLLIMV